ncbi:MAG: ATP-binding protein, partial [Bacteroidota bacterium]
GTDEVPLRRELDILDRYLTLEKVRFADRLTVHVEADDDARGARVPAWMLQPLVENALKHGIAPKPGPAEIRVHASREDDRLVVRVQDDGIGPEAAGARGRTHGTGVGLANTRARLDALYGRDASLTLASGADGGAVATLSLPYRPA